MPKRKRKLIPNPDVPILKKHIGKDLRLYYSFEEKQKMANDLNWSLTRLMSCLNLLYVKKIEERLENAKKEKV